MSLLFSLALFSCAPLALPPQAATQQTRGNVQGEGPPRRTIESLGERLAVVERGPRVRWTDDGLLRIGSDDGAELRDPATWELAEAPAESSSGEVSADDSDELEVNWGGSRPPYQISIREPGAEDSTQLHASADRIREGQAHPAGKFLSWVEAGDLWVADLTGKRPRVSAVTSDGDPDVLDGLLDWVYQEEIYGRGNFQAHWWSPVDPLLAFLTLEEHRVRSFPIIDFVPEGTLDTDRGVDLETLRYPKSGDANPTVELSIYDAAAGTMRGVKLDGMPRDGLIVRVAWTEDGATLLVTIQDRIQTWAELHAVDPVTGEGELWIREESQTWVNRPRSPIWLEDGRFLWRSERTGYNHLYLYERGGKLLGPVTAGEWQVRSVVDIDEEAGEILFEGTQHGAVDRNFYRTALAVLGEGSPGPQRLTMGTGSHSLTWSPDQAFFLDRFSSVSTPPRTVLCDGRTGEVLREVSSDTLDPAMPYAGWELIEIPARDGYPLDASVMRPLTGSPSSGAPAPLLLDIYSGPDAPTVRNSWRVSAWNQFLAQEGVMVLRVNVRTASGRGQAHTELCYLQLGVQELRDLEDSVDWAVANLGADADHVGITGWSYGGFMSAYALTHSDRFALGLAGAGVHDWRLYDTIYTERYMSTPQLNPDGYAKTSVLGAAGNLNGHLAILHGTIDDNVHLQNSIQLISELQQAGQTDFSLMLYPGWRHGVGSPHRTRFNWEAIEEHLLGR